MDNRIKRIVGHPVLQQILQSVTGKDAATIIHNGKTNIQIRIIAEHILHNLVMEPIVQELGHVGLKENISAVLVLRRLSDITFQFATLKNGLSHFAIAITVNLEMTA